MASDVKTIEAILERDAEARLSVSEWIVQLARKIRERPEDLMWFFEVRRLMRETEKLSESITDGELARWEEKVMAESVDVGHSLNELIRVGEESFRKFKRIEVKLKKLGVV